MTTLFDECKPTHPTLSDAVRGRIKAGMLMAFPAGMDEAAIDRAVDKILSALSDAGLAVGRATSLEVACPSCGAVSTLPLMQPLPTGEDR